MRHGLILALVLGVAGCQVLEIPSAKELAVSSAGVVGDVQASLGTAMIMGSAQQPLDAGAGFSTQSTSAGMQVELMEWRNGAMQPTGVRTQTNADGDFTLVNVPRGVTAMIRVTADDGSGMTMRKLTRVEQAVQCVKVDLATTVVADKIRSNDPLVQSDPALDGADLPELTRTDRLEAFEKEVRKLIAEAGSTLTRTQITSVLGEHVQDDGSQNAATLFNAMVAGKPTLVESYQHVFERLEAAIGVRISAVGINHNLHDNRRTVSGVMQLQIVEPPKGTTGIEFWFSSPKKDLVATASAAADWTTKLDTWKHPDGYYTLDAVAVVGGRRKLLGKLLFIINNSVAVHCSED